MLLSIAFWLLAAMSVVGALLVVSLKDIFRSALALVLCLVAVAGIYVTLQADFLAGVQVLVYVGAISILLIIGIMLTREAQQGGVTNRFRVPAFLTSIVFLAVLCFVVLWTPWQTSAADPTVPTSAPLGQIFFGNGNNSYLLTVEITGVLLLAAVIGAIAVARER
jgi:NADH-quinone oxidoreductase subunit J